MHIYTWCPRALCCLLKPHDGPARRMPYDGCPPDGKYPGDDSPVVWGQCGHAFHLQCIQKWIHSQAEQRCPMCRRAWEFKAAES